jgi:hypothetical protein
MGHTGSESVLDKPDKRKDLWDKLASVTPLILGICVTGVAALFTQIYNYRQLELNRITALDKFRPLLTSDRPEDREFGYESFAALGHEQLAIRIIKLKKDEAGRSVLVELKQSDDPQNRAGATDALKTLDEARKLVNMAEFGTPIPSAESLKKAPNLEKFQASTDPIVEDTAKKLGISSNLGLGILLDAVTQEGVGALRRYEEATSQLVSPPLGNREKEKAWLEEFLNQRQARLKSLPQHATFGRMWDQRIERSRTLLNAGDWDLKSLSDSSGKN